MKPVINGIAQLANIMAKYEIDGISLLKKNLVKRSANIDRYLSDTVNKTTTFARDKAVDTITSRVVLPGPYVKQRLKVISRASPRKPRAIIQGKTRATLLSRYPYLKSEKGVKVRVNADEGYKDIKQAFIINGLRGSFATGIAMRNEIAYQYYKSLNFTGEGRQAKIAKLNRLKKKARRRPKGIYVFHSRSINQLFDSVRKDIEPELKAFMAKDFLRRLNK